MKRRGFFAALLGTPAAGIAAVPKPTDDLIIKVSIDTSEVTAQMAELEVRFSDIQKEWTEYAAKVERTRTDRVIEITEEQARLFKLSGQSVY